MMGRSGLLLAGLLLCWSACGQQQTANVSVRVWNAKAPTAGTSAALRNIGQSQHLLSVQYADAGGTCLIGSSAAVYLEASFDGSNYFAITPQLIQLDASDRGQALANGIYPALRVRSIYNTTNCSLTVYYAGSLVTSAYPQTPRAVATGYLSANANATSTTGALVAPAVDSTSRIVVYGAWFTQQGAATTGQLYFAADATCVGTAANVAYANLALTAAPAVFPPSFVPYAYGGGGEALCFRLSGAGAANVQVIYRME